MATADRFYRGEGAAVSSMPHEAPQSESPLSSQHTMLREALRNLEQATDLLAERLNPALCPVPPAANPGKEVLTTQCGGSPLTCMLADLTMRVVVVRNQIAGIMERLEI
jgi:hypothetical protein